MPTQVTITKTLYKFDELSDDAKEKAREWYRRGCLHDEWWEFVYEDASTIAKLLGIDLDQKPVKLMNGSTRYDPAIYFSGFCSQGDGACFECSYSYAKGSVKAVKSHAPQDKELHRIAEVLQAVQRRHFYKITATSKHRGHYNHSGCMSIEVGCEHCDPGYAGHCEEEELIVRALRDFADWIYKQLETEHDYQMSDECVDENIKANEYDFDADGNRDD